MALCILLLFDNFQSKISHPYKNTVYQYITYQNVTYSTYGCVFTVILRLDCDTKSGDLLKGGFSHILVYFGSQQMTDKVIIYTTQ